MDTIEKLRTAGQLVIPQRYHQLVAELVRKGYLKSPFQTVTKTVGPARAEFHVTTREEAAILIPLTEYHVLRDLISRIETDDCFWDIGANVGKYTCLIGSVVEPDSVIAIEPHPENMKSLKRNIQLNRLSVNCHQCALGSKTGTVKLSHTQNEAGGNHSAYWETTDTIPVDMEVGDTLVDESELPQPTVVKIDIEGGEYKAIKGLKKTLAHDKCRLLYCEVHPSPLPVSENALFEMIRGLGFGFERLENSGNYTIRATK